ncbi:hypothetical protein ACJX0J_014870, partial [Zea mays]
AGGNFGCQNGRSLGGFASILYLCVAVDVLICYISDVVSFLKIETKNTDMSILESFAGEQTGYQAQVHVDDISDAFDKAVDGSEMYNKIIIGVNAHDALKRFNNSKLAGTAVAF